MVKIGIIGVGNCASSLLQGIQHYRSMGPTGLIFENIGNITPNDIEVVLAFDIDRRKVGKDISEAIFSKPNNTKVFYSDIKECGVKVKRGPTFDGLANHMTKYADHLTIVESNKKPVDVTKMLRKYKPDVLINYLPVGSIKAAEYYANCCLEAGVSFINAMPVFICSDKRWSKKFKKQKLVCIGDDVKAQIGATIVHRTLMNLLDMRGVKVLNTYQLNIGGNTDFLNMLDHERLRDKKISKTQAVQASLKNKLPEEHIHIGPSSFIPWLRDNKVCYIKIEGLKFGMVPFELDLKLSVEDSPNSAAIIIDAIRCCKLALINKKYGYLKEISEFGFKHPSVQIDDQTAYKNMKLFIDKYK